jgi:putative membrane protein
MNRKVSLLMSLGISLALIAAGIWFLYSHHSRFVFGDGRWIMPHHTMIGGSGMGIIMIVFWVVVITAIVLAVSGMISNRQAPSRREGDFGSSDALEILRRRYARGEIDKQQYETMLRDLEQGPVNA